MRADGTGLRRPVGTGTHITSNRRSVTRAVLACEDLNVTDSHAAGDDRYRLHYWERLLLAIFGLMLANASVGGPWGTLLRGGGWIVVAAALGVVEVLMAAYYRARRGR